MQGKAILFLCAANLVVGSASMFVYQDGALSSFANESDYRIILDEVEENVSLLTPLQRDYFEDEDHGNILSYASGTEERSKPLPLTLSFHPFSPEGKTWEKFIVELSLDSTFKSAETVEISANSTSFSNLMLGKTYYWRVRGNYDGGEAVSQVSSFQTSSFGLRNIDAGSVTNMRDLGGYFLGGGKRVKQGLIYRSARWNTSWINQRSSAIGEEGMKVLREQLKMRSEIDLRMASLGESSGITNSILGPDINYFDCSMGRGLDLDFYAYNANMIRYTFNLMADPNNYPLDFHCEIGTDRTGGVAYLLLGLLGVSEKDLERDFLFSNFGLIGSARSLKDIQDKTAYLRAFEGKTMAAKIESYLRSIGVWQSTIDQFKENMIETAEGGETL